MPSATAHKRLPSLNRWWSSFALRNTPGQSLRRCRSNSRRSARLLEYRRQALHPPRRARRCLRPTAPSPRCRPTESANESGFGKELTTNTLGSTSSEPAVHHIVMGRSAPCAMLMSGADSGRGDFIEAAGPTPLGRNCREMPRGRRNSSTPDSLRDCPSAASKSPSSKSRIFQRSGAQLLHLVEPAGGRLRKRQRPARQAARRPPSVENSARPGPRSAAEYPRNSPRLQHRHTGRTPHRAREVAVEPAAAEFLLALHMQRCIQSSHSSRNALPTRRSMKSPWLGSLPKNHRAPDIEHRLEINRRSGRAQLVARERIANRGGLESETRNVAARTQCHQVTHIRLGELHTASSSRWNSAHGPW